MRARKVSVYFNPNLDGLSAAAVATTSVDEACRLMGCAANSYREFGGQRLPPDDPQHAEIVQLAMANERTVFYRSLRYSGAQQPPWTTQPPRFYAERAKCYVDSSDWAGPERLHRLVHC